jgi:diguanylate cyclase (GGDEF)-like protein
MHAIDDNLGRDSRAAEVAVEGIATHSLIETKRYLTAPAEPPPGACLVQIHPPGLSIGSRHSLGASGSVVVGRDPRCDIVLKDASISRRHAEIRAGFTGHYLIDLGSTNGSFVNHVRASTCKLHDGDYVRFGDWTFRYLSSDNVEAKYHEEIYRLTILDPLTGAHNQRYLLEYLERELPGVSSERPFSLLLLDLDRFKAINDGLGHVAGDAVLRELAQRVRGVLNHAGPFARYGGEEFAVALPQASADAAFALAERLREAVATAPFLVEGQLVPVTVSIGVATTSLPVHAVELIGRADAQLYRAKATGRNCVCAA